MIPINMKGVKAVELRGYCYREDADDDETCRLINEGGKFYVEVPYDSGVCAVMVEVDALLNWLQANGFVVSSQKGTVTGRQSQIQNLPRSAQEVIDQHKQYQRMKQLERDSEELSWLKNPDQMGK